MSAPAHLRIATENRPYPGQHHSGDWPFYFCRENALLMGVADGLGHGDLAYASSMRVKAFLDAGWHPELPRLFDGLNAHLAGGQGAALALVHVSLSDGALRFAGIGNVRAWLFGSAPQSFVSRDGVLGQHYRTPVLQQAAMAEGDKLVIASDGLQERLATQCDRETLSCPPETLAHHLLQRFGKAYDDASCLVFEL